jgi:hypothetical protein
MTTTARALTRDIASARPTPTGGRRVSTPAMIGAIAAVAAVDRAISLFARRPTPETATVVALPQRHRQAWQDQRAA